VPADMERRTEHLNAGWQPSDRSGSPSPDSRLLRLSVEILDAVTGKLARDTRALASFALVNSFCRHLARRRQFSSVRFDCSRGAHSLILHLIQSAKDGQLDSGIGAHIREITVEEGRYGATCRLSHIHQFDAHHGDYPEGCHIFPARDESFEPCCRRYLLLAIEKAMPRLDVIKWRHIWPADFNVLRTISHTRIRHLEFSRTTLDEPWLLQPPMTPPAMALQSLCLRLGTVYAHSDGQKRYAIVEPRSLAPVISGLLALCAPSLEKLCLVIRSSHDARIIDLGTAFFPRLKYLSFVAHNIGDGRRASGRDGPVPSKPALLSLLGPRIQHLVLSDVGANTGLSLGLSGCAVLRDLESLAFVHPSTSTGLERLTAFLARHPHIRMLHMSPLLNRADSDAAPDAVDAQILPLLVSGGFDNLRFLTLLWIPKGPPGTAFLMPLGSIAPLGHLKSLDQLCLDTRGTTSLPRWLIDHEFLRGSLKPLTKLKRLAVCGDIYGVQEGCDIPERYVPVEISEADELDAARRLDLDDPAFAPGYHPDEIGETTPERAHRNRMLREAEEYAKVLPCLEWACFGQRPMALTTASAPSGTKVAVPLTRGRMRISTIPDHVFAVPDDGMSGTTVRRV